MLGKKLISLEVERKFIGLAVQDLTRNAGNPPFNSIMFLGQHTFRDTYFDSRKLLSSAGLWVRQRNGQWEAKIRQGGDFVNSRFEEIFDHSAISRHVAAVTGASRDEKEHFGLVQIASLTTIRQSWLADSDFKIVLDSMDFGHVVGEVELQQDIEFDGSAELVERQKQMAMQAMDDRIAEFMKRYHWAFCSGQPKGKLTAYFERFPLQSI